MRLRPSSRGFVARRRTGASAASCGLGFCRGGRGGGRFGGCRAFGEILFQLLAGFEVGDPLCRHIDGLAGFRIAATARASLSRAETAETAELNLFAFVQRADYRVEDCFDYYFGVAFVQLSRASNFLNKFCLSHLSPVRRKLQRPFLIDHYLACLAKRSGRNTRGPTMLESPTCVSSRVLRL